MSTCLYIKFSMLTNYPQYERECFVVFLDVIRQKYFISLRQELQLLEDKKGKKRKINDCYLQTRRVTC